MSSSAPLPTGNGFLDITWQPHFGIAHYIGTISGFFDVAFCAILGKLRFFHFRAIQKANTPYTPTTLRSCLFVTAKVT